ncbi:MAG: UDP-glucose/GDP-mannose dehydrogenase family protein [bacterium]|nr:UDP-glucose/GDP-mannose dehydrogenase family protein [bacterium]
MKVGMAGVGYVGLVAGACLADGGNHVTCMDKDEQKIKDLKEGGVPIYEPGLLEIVKRNVKAGRLQFTTDWAETVKSSLVLFIGVGTPPAADGSADLSAILEVAEGIGRHMDGYRIVVMKSTVPVGTHKKVIAAVEKHTEHDFDYVSNPEFLKEGAAIEDFTRPDRVIFGTTNPAVVEIMKEIYAPFMRKVERFLVMDPASAEMSKYAANAMLATRISFVNEIAGLCERFGADVESVRRGMGSDSRIGPAFLYPGVGYGGSCFPKDVTALIAMGEEVDFPMSIAQSVHAVNQRQRILFANRILDYFGDACAETTLAVWGLAFKSRTDDVRESPAIAAIRMFQDRGMKIRAFDPEAMDNTRAALGSDLEAFDDCYGPLEGADGLVIFTDWPEFRMPDFERMKRQLRHPLVFDGRNLYEPRIMKKHGFEYHCIGRPNSGSLGRRRTD